MNNHFMSILGSSWQEHDWESSILGYRVHFVETATCEDETSDLMYGKLTCLSLYSLPKATHHKLVFFEIYINDDHLLAVMGTAFHHLRKILGALSDHVDQGNPSIYSPSRKLSRQSYVH